jgi:hypothetical protein
MLVEGHLPRAHARGKSEGDERSGAEPLPGLSSRSVDVGCEFSRPRVRTDNNPVSQEQNETSVVANWDLQQLGAYVDTEHNTQGKQARTDERRDTAIQRTLHDQSSPNGQRPLSEDNAASGMENSVGSVLDSATAERVSKELVRQLFDSLKSTGSLGSEDTRLFFPEGISLIQVHLKAGGAGTPATDVEFTVSSTQQ